jgi:hypothetical protein
MNINDYNMLSAPLLEQVKLAVEAHYADEWIFTVLKTGGWRTGYGYHSLTGYGHRHYRLELGEYEVSLVTLNIELIEIVLYSTKHYNKISCLISPTVADMAGEIANLFSEFNQCIAEYAQLERNR